MAQSKPADTPSAPSQEEPAEGSAHRQLYTDVKKALFALPSSFKTDLLISGVLATDLFTFNTSLGATIESQVVDALNELREVWDEHNKYATYSFVRQSQRFPDVILRTLADGVEPPILLGIELKGWYVLAKEREPSFRYKVTPAVPAKQDLLAVFPWALNNVVSGSPKLFQPFVTCAAYAAQYRNYWWEHVKSGSPTASNAIKLSSAHAAYPSKSDAISDVPVSDGGNNFGRFARTGIMDEYMGLVFREELSGIPLSAWQRFLSAFTEEAAEAKINRAIDQAIQKAAASSRSVAAGIDDVKATLNRIVALLDE